MNRRDVLKGAAAGALAVWAPRFAQAQQAGVTKLNGKLLNRCSHSFPLHLGYVLVVSILLSLDRNARDSFIPISYCSFRLSPPPP